MRWFPLFILTLLGTALAGEQPYPFWDGTESVANYAKKVNLSPTKTLDLGNNIKLELMLIPGGKFMMGTPEPMPVDEEGYRKKIVMGQALLAVSSVALLVMLTVIVVLAIRKHQRPKFSLLWLLAMTVLAGGCVLSSLHWQRSAGELLRARLDYKGAKVRYDFADKQEKPAHSVTLTKPFYMGKFLVTQEQYQQVMGQNPSEFNGRDNPVDRVSWNDAQAFCKNLNAITHQAVRLPTEAEWEHACRAGTTTAFFSGDTEADLARVAWYSANSNNTPHPVGQKEPNKFGLYDMHGNLWQWCQDWFGDDYYSKSPTEDPQGPAQGNSSVWFESRLLRGGSYCFLPNTCRAAVRSGGSPGDAYSHFGLGFRVVVEPSSKVP